MKNVLSLCLLLLVEIFTSSAATIEAERSDLIEGDIYIGDKNTRTILRTLSHRRVARNALLDPLHLWPSAKVPYQFAAGVIHMDVDRENLGTNRGVTVFTLTQKNNSDLLGAKTKQVVKQAINDLEKYTCVRFVLRTKEEDYINIVSKGKLCYSAIGRSRGPQNLSLGSGCPIKGIAIHELMHSIGFFHEHSRLDRDKYVTIQWSNIDSKQIRNFRMYEHGEADGQGETYDYSSLMHYHRHAFSKNGKPTIVPKQSGASIGQRVGLSSIDIKKINKLYKCGTKATAALVPTTTTEPTTVETTTVQPTTIESTTEEENAPTARERCIDRHFFCAYYATYCRHRSVYYRLFMKRYCTYTCGYCKRGSVDV